MKVLSWARVCWAGERAGERCFVVETASKCLVGEKVRLRWGGGHVPNMHEKPGKARRWCKIYVWISAACMSQPPLAIFAE